jgi:hypothetical protein
LRPSLDVAIARATHREGRQLREVEPIVGLYGAFADLGMLEAHVIDSSSQTIEQTAADVVTGLRHRRFTLGLAD